MSALRHSVAIRERASVSASSQLCHMSRARQKKRIGKKREREEDEKEKVTYIFIYRNYARV